MTPTRSRPSLGETTRRVQAAQVEGAKRYKVLFLIAAAADAGTFDPSITLLTQHSKLPRPAVLAIVDQLERDGLLEIRRGDPGGRRNEYIVLPDRGHR